jgi:uncharacterized protein (TIGR04255 family)
LNYVRPPILEASIEFFWVDALKFDALERVLDDDFGRLSEKRKIQAVEAQIDTSTGDFTSEQTQTGYELRSEDGGEKLEVRMDGLKYTQVAPYRGWDDFVPHAVEALLQLSAKLGVSTIKEMQTRYVNRLDIPLGGDGRVDTHDYVNVDVHGLYGGDGGLRDLQLRVSKDIQDSPFFYWLSFAVLQSPVPKCAGFFLDIVLVCNQPTSIIQSDIMVKLNGLHVEKNNVFERTITDSARELFGGEKK